MTSAVQICDEAEEWARIYAESLAKLRAQRALELQKQRHENQSGGECLKAAPQGSSRDGSRPRGKKTPSSPPLIPAQTAHKKKSSSTNGSPIQATSNQGQGSERRLPVGFGARTSRPQAPRRRRWPSSHQRRFKSKSTAVAADLADYSHSTPIGGWSIPSMDSDGSQPSTCQALKKGRAPAVAYTRNEEEAEELLQCIPLGSALGFDMEWNFEWDTQRSYKTALVQICSPSLIVIIQLSALKRLPPRLRTLLEDRNTIKTGVAIKADFTKLERDYGVAANGVLELSTFARRVQVEYWRQQNKKGLISLQQLCRTYLERHLVKDEVRTSDWEQELSARQVQYAASDTYVGLEILGKLCGIANDEAAAAAAAEEEAKEVQENTAATVDESTSRGSLQKSATKVKAKSTPAAIDSLEEAALAAFAGEKGSTKKTRAESIVIEDSSEDESSNKAERRPLGSIDTSARINTEVAAQKKSGWLTRGKAPLPSSDDQVSSVGIEPRSVTVMKALLIHKGSDGHVVAKT